MIIPVRFGASLNESHDEFVARAVENAKRYQWSRLGRPLMTPSLGAMLRGGEGPGSFLSGTQAEVIFANRTSGTALSNFTAEASLVTGMTELGTTAGSINLGLPANHFKANGGVGMRVRVCAKGVYSDTTVAPTFTLGLRFGSAAGALQATSIAWTVPAVSLTNMQWEWEADYTCLTTGPGTTATCRVTGRIIIQGAANGTADLFLPFCAGSAFGTPTPATPTGAGFDSTIAQAIVPTAACGTANAANSIQLTDICVLGMN